MNLGARKLETSCCFHMNISLDQIKELRDETGISVMQCKKALEEAGGDMEKARVLLAKKSSAIAAKKADRATNSGIVAIGKGEGEAAMIELLCETDFVARNEDFIALADKLSNYALSNGEAMTQKNAEEMIAPVVQKIGENIKLGNVIVMKGPVIGSYIHDRHIGVLVNLSSGDETLAKDVAMHIAAMKPIYTRSTDIPEDKKTAAREIFENEVKNENKPEEIKEKILEGKVASHFKEQTLLEQAFIKDPTTTIGKLLSTSGNVEVKQFVCYTI